jgi:hypothetical protein
VIRLVALAICLGCLTSAAASTLVGANARNLILLYSGSSRPMRITPAVAAAYLTNQSCGSGTLFDSVLFTEIKSPSGAYYWPGPDRRGATQGEWRDFADSLFAPGFNISALESAAEKEFGTAVDHSGKKISVYISMPVPDSRLRDWGSVDGKRLDLSSDKDRIAAVMWYVNEIDRHWKSLSLGAITLAGYYWNAESVDDAASIMPVIGRTLAARKLSFVWIPFWQAYRVPINNLGFSEVYIQPNYYEYDVPVTRISDAVRMAAKYAFGIELEFDDGVLKDPVKRKKLTDTVDELRKIKEMPAIAVYDGAGAFVRLLSSRNPEVGEAKNELINFLCRVR